MDFRFAFCTTFRSFSYASVQHCVGLHVDIFFCRSLHVGSRLIVVLPYAKHETGPFRSRDQFNEPERSVAGLRVVQLRSEVFQRLMILSTISVHEESNGCPVYAARRIFDQISITFSMVRSLSLLDVKMVVYTSEVAAIRKI